MGRKYKLKKEDLAMRMSKTDFLKAVEEHDGDLTVLNRNVGGAEISYVMKSAVVGRVRNETHESKLAASRFVWMSGVVIKDDIALFLTLNRGE